MDMQLSNGSMTIVDDADFVLLSRWKWRENNRGYVYRNIRMQGTTRKLYLHRFLLNPPEGMETDHINRNPKDNRKANLRSVPHWKNTHNRSSRPTKTGVRGVWKHGNKWQAMIYINGRPIYLGTYLTKAEAAHVRVKAEIKYGVRH